ncbi:FtsX-like permease family protein [Aliikangiella sp. G2MR2-5]|uniref:FtsX-like permease family protein n=1 Tax=Aliikangiella sp. G2MR2-5 TaxID=2788943 RepID=UPI0018AB2B55|nr:FtsX-like permease family protein [Aliikangiella sp. G2MR2-5]
MLGHIFKMLWNRKSKNALITIEVAISFIVVFALAAISIRYTWLYHQPLGYQYEDIWWIRIDNPEEWNQEKDRPTIQQMVTALEQLPEVDSVHVISLPVFTFWSWKTNYKVDDKELFFNKNRMDDRSAQAMGMTISEGRWFGNQDAGQSYTAVVVNQLFADEFYPGESIIGKNVASTEQQEQPAKEMRVVGVIKDFKQFGELSEPVPYLIERFDLAQDSGKGNERLHLKLNQKVTPEFEAKIISLLRNINPQWDYFARSLEQSRHSQLMETIIPIAIFAVIAFFLIIMVGMGLLGVLWQNVSRRTQEIGLRRALGATASMIHRQVIGELAVICSLGITIALLLLIQLPLLGVLPELNWTLFTTAAIVSVFFMLLLSFVCAYYPGKVATTYTPAMALHYE